MAAHGRPSWTQIACLGERRQCWDSNVNAAKDNNICNSNTRGLGSLVTIIMVTILKMHKNANKHNTSSNHDRNDNKHQDLHHC